MFYDYLLKLIKVALLLVNSHSRGIKIRVNVWVDLKNANFLVRIFLLYSIKVTSHKYYKIIYCFIILKDALPVLVSKLKIYRPVFKCDNSKFFIFRMLV